MFPPCSLVYILGCLVVSLEHFYNITIDLRLSLAEKCHYFFGIAYSRFKTYSGRQKVLIQEYFQGKFMIKTSEYVSVILWTHYFVFIVYLHTKYYESATVPYTYRLNSLVTYNNKNNKRNIGPTKVI